ncbi:MAG: hypothetical protein ACJAYU_000560 [Bradymonadia bacterium]
MLVAGAVTLALLSGCGAAALRGAVGAADFQVHTAGDEAGAAARHHALEQAQDAACYAVELAVANPNAYDFRRASFMGAMAAGDLANASLVVHFWQPERADADAYEIYLRTLSLIGRGPEAESLAWRAATEDPDNRHRWMRAWYSALAADRERFPLPMGELHAGVQVDELRAFDGSSSIIMRYIVDDETIGIFKPHQNVRHQSFRGEVAAYRLCHLIRCTFVVPLSAETFVEEAEFRALAGVSSSDRLNFRTARRTPTFFEDDQDRQVLYGVFKSWVPDFSRFPLEYREVWLPLVQNGVTEDELSALSVRRALSQFDGRRRGFFGEIVARSEGMTASNLARQLSELHVFDLLINNFDRYQAEWYGMNVHWQQGGFVSIDNGASFSLPEEFSFTAARRRCQLIEVFPRSMIDAIRWLEPEEAFALLFPPNPYFDDEEGRFAYFIERRQWLLDHVDNLVAQYGEDEVFLWD